MSIRETTRRIGTRVPSWYDVANEAPVQYWGTLGDAPESYIEAALYQDDERVWVESWDMDIGITTFWEADTIEAGVELANLLVRGAL